MYNILPLNKFFLIDFQTDKIYFTVYCCTCSYCTYICRMSLYRQAAKRDANEAEIIKALRQCGISVQPLSTKGVPDLLCGYKGKNYILEVKQERGKLTPDQVTWHEKWRGGKPYIVHDIAEALAVFKIKF